MRYLNGPGAKLCKQSGSNQNVKSQETRGNYTIQRQAAAALMNEVNKENMGEANYQTHAVQKVQPNHSHTGSWAQIAGSFSNHQVNSHDMAVYVPCVDDRLFCIEV